MSKPSMRQVMLLRSLRCLKTGSSSTWWIAKLNKITPAAARNDLAFLEAAGLVARADRSSGDHTIMWGRTTSGSQWLASLDAGRPWMVRGYKR